jgi:hypothetical protein
LISDIPGGDGKTANSFLQCMVYTPDFFKCRKM